MKKLVAAGVFVVVLVEVVAFAVLDRELVLVVVGVMVALVLLALRFYLVREPGYGSDSALSNDAAESLRRWLSRTETLVSRSDSTRRDWDRHLRPMLARQFETGHRTAAGQESRGVSRHRHHAVRGRAVGVGGSAERVPDRRGRTRPRPGRPR